MIPHAANAPVIAASVVTLATSCFVTALILRFKQNLTPSAFYRHR